MCNRCNINDQKSIGIDIYLMRNINVNKIGEELKHHKHHTNARAARKFIVLSPHKVPEHGYEDL